MVTITIDGHEYEVEEGQTVLQALRFLGVQLPTLCYHPALKPSGSCRLCAVEVMGKSGRPVAMLSCIMPVQEGLQIRTDSEIVQNARRKAFQRLLQMAPQSRRILDLAQQYGVDLGPPPDGCVRCRLCIRVCKEIIGVGALRMEKREGVAYVVPAEGACIGCGTCANLCPTGAIVIRDTEDTRTISIRDEIIGIHALERCEACGRQFATHKFLEFAEEHAQPHPDVKEHHRYCPTCAKLLADRVQLALRQRQR
ncbi:4Fe-4S dicluster domain-containing protein [Desulfacinum hydrothermale DSM 13146]|uniref:4Fe-4S dicluster domain-containing protein n=1 Tax=Desulfacinum hydrothermale DSM 13146 TaxID=1121390 RepID=A0A1W1XEX9_9BACT|nr:2Fe-2S iron-sulfur cluster-binding protein [Desulfacinum hydrothermale]SMC22417.1 4Fe-4S dicluster domain-containing protein [Desulfacinum hydrothermale DSM 13146]